MAESGTIAPPVDGVGAVDAAGAAVTEAPAVGEAMAATVGVVAGAGAAVVAAAATVAGIAVVAPTTLLALRKIPFRESGLNWYLGSTSITTKYWLSAVYMVETSRWPKAS